MANAKAWVQNVQYIEFMDGKLYRHPERLADPWCVTKGLRGTRYFATFRHALHWATTDDG